MKKAKYAFLVLISLLLAVNITYAMSGVPAKVTAEATRLANDFTNIAMAEFKTVSDSQLNYPAISAKVQEYSLNMAEILLEGGLDKDKAAMLMQKAAVLYGQALKALFNQENFNLVIQGYSEKISALFSKEHLDIKVQSPIISAASDNLESLNETFRAFQDIGQ